jgi:cytochrome b6-f complex iron-sulfur subunit
MTEETPKPSSDRRFLLKAGLAALAAAGAALVAGVGRFLKPRVVYEPPMRFAAGPPAEFPPGAVSTKFMDEQQVAVIHGPDGIYAFLTVCTHLGCVVNFDAAERVFKCPCHGSVFALDGKVLGGPAPLPLARASLSLDALGRIVVNKADTANIVDDASRGKFLIKGLT